MGLRTIGIRQIGIHKPRVGRLGSSSSYWTPPTLSSLTVMTLTDTVQSMVVTITGDQGDGNKFEYSTDGVNYTVHGQSVDGNYLATGLTQGTLYYWRARAFKGSSYGDYSNVDSDTTLLSETINLLDTIDSDPIMPRISAINSLIYNLKNFDTDIWSGLDVFRIGKAHEAKFTRANWVKNDHHQTVFNTPPWTEDLGYTYNGTDITGHYAKSDYVPSVDADNYAQNSASIGIKLSEYNNTAIRVPTGGQHATNPTAVITAINSTTARSCINTAYGATAYINRQPAAGWNWLQRSAADASKFKTAAGETTNALASTGLPSMEFGEMCGNWGGTFRYQCPGVEQAFVIGRYFTDDEKTKIDAEITAYEAILAANPNTFPIAGVTSVTTAHIALGARLMWVDSGSYDNEIWAKVNNGAYSLIDTIAAGVNYYNYEGHSISDVITFKIRAKNGVEYSAFTKSVITVLETVHIESVQGSVVDNVSIALLKVSGTSQINWGVGNEVNITNGTFTSNYPAGNTTYDIYISGDLDGITSFSCQNEVTAKFNVEELWKFTALQICNLSAVYNYMDGALEGMPATLTQLTLNPTTNSYGNAGSNQCTLSNPTFTWPVGLTRLYLGSLAGNISGVDTEKIFFSIEDLPATLTYLNIAQASNENYGITGDESNMPPNMEKWLVQGCWGLEWSGGDLPASLVEWYNENVDDTAFIGDFNTKLPIGLTKLFFVGNAAIVAPSGLTGSIDGIMSRCPDLQFIWLSEGFSYNIAGELQALVASLKFCGLNYTGAGKYTYSGGALPAWPNCAMGLLGNLITAEVDLFLNTWALTATATPGSIDLAGNNQPRSSASDAAVATLEGLGKTVITN